MSTIRSILIKVVIALWVLWSLVRLCNLQALTTIDTHTIHETAIIEKEYVDAHHVENFVENFAKSTIHGSNPISPLIIRWKV